MGTPPLAVRYQHPMRLCTNAMLTVRGRQWLLVNLNLKSCGAVIAETRCLPLTVNPGKVLIGL